MMSETLDPMATVVDQQQLAEPLPAQAKEQGVDLIGPNGLLNQLTKNVLETALDAEITERPPLIPLYTALARIPGSTELLRFLIRWRPFLLSRATFGDVFADRKRLDDDFFRCVVEPVVKNRRRREGLRRYLLGFDWAVVDNFRTIHRELSAPVLMIWGADDPFFPLHLARDMAEQFTPAAELVVIPDAKLLVHEEHPAQVAAAVMQFVQSQAC